MTAKQWSRKRLKHLALQTPGSFVDGPFGSNLKNEEYQPEGVPLIQLNNIKEGTHDLTERRFVSEAKARELARHTAVPGDIVIAKMADPVARATIVDNTYSNYVIVADCVRLRPGPDVDAKFLVFAINSRPVRSEAEARSTGSTRLRINLSEIKELEVWAPNRSTQEQARMFLDYHTARIDALIAKKRRLLELLEEKHEALVTGAVTGDETAPRRWPRVAARRLFTRLEQGWSPDCEDRLADPSGWGVLKAGAVNGGTFIETKHKALPAGVAPETEYEVHSGDVLMNRASGSMDLLGSVGFVARVRPRLLLCDKLYRVHLTPVVVPKYFVWLFGSRLVRSQVRVELSGAEGLANNISQEAIREFVVPLPPVKDQEEIVRRLELWAAHLHEIRKNLRISVSLLDEKRSALITVAVAGQLDVSTWTPPAQGTPRMTPRRPP